MKRLLEVLAIVLVAVFLALSLTGTHGGGTPLRDAFVERGPAETGALNLVTAIYLGYRAYDTLGEATVLFTAVIGATVILRRQSRKSLEDPDL